MIVQDGADAERPGEIAVQVVEKQFRQGVAGVALPVAEQDIGYPDCLKTGIHGLVRVMPGHDGPQGGGVREKAPFGVSVYLQQVLEIPALDGSLFLEGQCTAGLVDEGDGAELGGNLVDDVVVLIFAAGVVGVGLQAGILGEVEDGDVLRPGESLFGELDDFAVHGVFSLGQHKGIVAVNCSVG